MKVNDERLFQSYRVEDFTCTILSLEGTPVGKLDDRIDGTVTFSTDSRIKSAGRLTFIGKVSPDWWIRHLLQITVNVNGYEWPLGVFVPSVPKRIYSTSDIRQTVELHDKLLWLEEDAVPQAYSLPTGTNLRDKVVELIKSVGETNVNVTEFVPKPRPGGGVWSDGTNKRPMTWDAGTPKLTIINDILDYIGYFSLSCDGNGQFRARPYQIPSERPVSWELHEGVGAVHSTHWAYEEDIASIPNRVVYTTQDAAPKDGTKIPLLTSSLENRDPKSPYSYPSRGRWVTYVKTDAEALSQKELDQMVARRMRNAQKPVAKVTVDNALLPFELNDIVSFRSGDIELFMSVRRMEITLEPGTLMQTTLRRVNFGSDDEEGL